MANRKLVGAAIGVAVVAVALWAWLLWPRSPPEPPPRHPLDVVVVLDTTASMGPMIAAVQKGISGIATHARATDPVLDIRIGLVAYRDVGDVYVTKVLDLTADVDAVQHELMGYTADGGGDVPEDVDAGLHAAVQDMHWRRDAKQVVILVGDAPPATRGDVPAVDITVHQAAERHIVIDAIWYGASPATGDAWRAITTATGGEVAQVAVDAEISGFDVIVGRMLDRLLAR